MALDGSSRRAAVLHQEALDLSSEAAKLRKAASSDPKAATRLKQIATRLIAVESEYSSLLSASPHAAPPTPLRSGALRPGRDEGREASRNGCRSTPAEISVLQSENKELCRRNTELEKLVLSLSEFQREAKDQILQAGSRITRVEDKEALLLRRLGDAEREIAVAREEAARSSVTAGVADDSWLEAAAQQLTEAAKRIEEMQVEDQAARIEARLVSTTREIAELRREVNQLETTLLNERKRADTAELLAEDLHEEVQSISSQVSEARRLMQNPATDGNGSALRDWAEIELERLKQQLAAASA